MASSVRFDTSAKHLNSQQNNQNVNAQSKQTSGTPIQKQLSSGSTSQSQRPVTQFGQFVTNQFRQSPVKHTTSSGSNSNTPLLDSRQHSEGKESALNQKKSEETQIFQSNDDQEEEYQESDNQEDGGDPIFAGDSDFEPAEQSIILQNVLPKHSIQKGNFTSQNYFDVVTNNSLANQYEFDQDLTTVLSNQYRDDIDYKLMQEHEISSYYINKQRPLDNADAIYRLRSSTQSEINLQNHNQINYDRLKASKDEKYKNNFNDTTKPYQISSHYSSDKSSDESENCLPKQNIVRNQDNKQSYSAKSQVDQEFKQQTFEIASGSTSKEIQSSNSPITKPQVIQYHSDRGIAGVSSNVRKFERGIDKYQSSFSKPQNTGQQNDEQNVCYDKFYRTKNDSSFSSQDNEENEILINNEFKSRFYQDNYSKTNAEKQQSNKQGFVSSKIETDYFDQSLTARNNQKQAASRLATIKDQNNNQYEVNDDDSARFKSTAVGFSPNINQVYGYNLAKINDQTIQEGQNQQPSKSITSFGWSQKDPTAQMQQSPNSRAATFETGNLTEQKMQDLERAQKLGQYAKLYPQMEITREQFEMQNRNVQGSTINTQQKQKEKRKKKKEQAPEAHFLLTGFLAPYLEQRSFFRNQSSDSKLKNQQQIQDAQEDNTQDPGNTQALKEWFESLSLQDRVNSLTTTYPIFVSSIIEAQQKHSSSNGPLCLFQMKKQKEVEVTPAEQTAGRRRIGQQNETELTIFERYLTQDDQFRSHNIYSDQQQTRQTQTKIIKFCRITSNKSSNDTLTVDKELVKDSYDFFGLLDVITDGKAFSQPISYVTRNGGGGRPIIQSPKWIDNKKVNYLGVWIVAILEETLWAHFNFARQVNISQGVRKNELNQLFELRSENLNNQEDLAKRWTELGDEGQQKLINRLSQIAKEKLPSQFHKEYDEKEQQIQGYQQHNTYQHTHYNEDIYKYCNQQKYGLYQFSEVPVRTHNDMYQSELPSPYFTRAQTNYLEQQGSINILSQTSSHNKYMIIMHNDTDLKDIIDTISYIAALESIKFLSEFPLQEVNQRKYKRRHFLCEQLHDLIKENLRQSIQDQLMNDLLANEQHKTTNVQETDDKKNKNKKNKDVRKNKNKKITQNQVPTYQKKKSISKSPIRQQIIVNQQPHTSKETQKPIQKNQQQVKLQENKETASRVASTTTSDDQTGIVSLKQVEQKIQQAKQQQRKEKKQSASTEQKKASTLIKQQQLEQQSAIKELISVLMNEIVESVCQIEAERINKLSELTKQDEDQQIAEQLTSQVSLETIQLKNDDVETDQSVKDESKNVEVKESNQQEKTKRKRRSNQQKKKEKLVNNFIREKFQIPANDLLESQQASQTNANKNGRAKQVNNTSKQGAEQNSNTQQNKGVAIQPQQNNKGHQFKQTKNQQQQTLQSKGQAKPGQTKDTQVIEKNDKKQYQSQAQTVNVQKNRINVDIEDKKANSKHTNSTTSLVSKDSSDQVQVKELQKIGQPIAKFTKKPNMSETQTILVFNIDPSDIATLQVEEVTSEPINDSVKEVIQEPEVKPVRESISLTDHFIQQPLDLNDLRDFKMLDDVFDKSQNSQIYENSKIKFIDYSAPVQTKIQAPFQWQADQSSNDDNSKIGMSTTSVSFTPTLQLSPQISHMSYEDETQKQQTYAQEPFQFMPIGNGSPPTINKFNSSPQPQGQYQNNLLNNEIYQRPQFAQMPNQQVLNFEQSQKGHYQPQSYRHHQPDYQHPQKGQGPYKTKGPFRQPNYSQYTTPPQAHFGQKYQSQAQYPEYQQYPSNDLNSSARVAKNPQYQNKKHGDEFAYNQYQNYQGQQDIQSQQAPQIRLDAPSFDPVQFQDKPLVSSVPQEFKKQNWNQQPYQVQLNLSQQVQKSDNQFQNIVYNEPIIQIDQTPLYIELQKQFYRSFDKDIKKSTEKVLSIIERFKEERKYVKKKLQLMAEAAFPGRNPKIKIFGSIKTGLALETSDMDIAVTGLKIDGREEMIDYLNAMADQVQKWGLIKDFKAIETASIPVIKAILRYSDISDEMGKPYINADPNAELPIDITFDDSPVKPLQMQHPHQQIVLDPMTQLQNLINGEFGIINDPLMGYGMEFGGAPQPKTHLGLASCDLLKYYVSVYPCLKEVALLLKRFLAVNNLNHPYLGGISSYSAVLLIVAYMNEYGLHRDPNLTPSLLLHGFLDFYSNHFNPKVFGVNTTDGLSFYLLPQQNQHMFVIVDPVNLTNNTARNSFRTPEVLDHFRAAYQSLKNQITMRYYKIIETEKAQQSAHDPSTSKLSDWGDKTSINYSPVTQQIKVEKTSDGIGQRSRHGAQKKGHAQSQFDPTATKASEQQQPSSNQAGQTVSNANQLFPKNVAATGAGLVQQPSVLAFDSLNLVQCFLSLDVMKEGGTDKQVEMGSCVSGVAF